MRVINPKTVVQFLSFEKEDRAGFLWKRRSDGKGSFKKRYFIACGNILAYFEKRLDKEPLGILILEGHTVEMVDDLTMAIRFPTLGEASRSYLLRGESPDDVEQWMRVLSRSGIDFFSLTLEDLEDQLNALITMRKSLSPRSPPIALDIQSSDSVSPHLPKRTNPFNRMSCEPEYARVASEKTQEREFDNKNTPPESTAPPVLPDLAVEHLRWLFSQDWEQLHEYVRTCLIRHPTAASSGIEKDLIDLG
ncbi:unnamed protein product [Calicophoron daubneyi]|uniref:PH domain-containing protein n=1 Tax=Calicophoron daubneyi TaxID=300641 RepID=A0AAV2T7T3_CALDB